MDEAGIDDNPEADGDGDSRAKEAPKRRRSKPPYPPELPEAGETSDEERDRERAAEFAALRHQPGPSAIDALQRGIDRAFGSLRQMSVTPEVPLFDPNQGRRAAERAAVDTREYTREHVNLAGQQLMVLQEVREISIRMERSSNDMADIARNTLLIAALAFGITFVQLLLLLFGRG